MLTLSEILEAACDTLGVTADDVRQRHRTVKSSTARGLYYVIALEQKYSPTEAGDYVARSRVACLLTAKKYIGYISIGDKYIKRLYAEITAKLTK